MLPKSAEIPTNRKQYKIYEKMKKVIDFLTAGGYLIIVLKWNHCIMKMRLLTKER